MMLSVKIIIKMSQILIDKPLKKAYDMKDIVLSNVVDSYLWAFGWALIRGYYDYEQ